MSKRVLWVVEAKFEEDWGFEPVPRMGFTRAQGKIRVAEFREAWPGTPARLVKYVPAPERKEKE